jgi:hypothetical protein
MIKSLIQKIRNAFARWFCRKRIDSAPPPDLPEPDVEMNVDQLAAALRQISDAISKLSASLSDVAAAVAESLPDIAAAVAQAIEVIKKNLAKKARAKKQYRKFAAARYVHVPIHTDNGYKIRAPTARHRLLGTAKDDHTFLS